MAFIVNAEVLQHSLLCVLRGLWGTMTSEFQAQAVLRTVLKRELETKRRLLTNKSPELDFTHILVIHPAFLFFLAVHKFCPDGHCNYRSGTAVEGMAQAAKPANAG